MPLCALFQLMVCALLLGLLVYNVTLTSLSLIDPILFKEHFLNMIVIVQNFDTKIDICDYLKLIGICNMRCSCCQQGFHLINKVFNYTCDLVVCTVPICWYLF